MTIDAQAALAQANSALQTVADAVAEKDASLSALSLQVDSLGAANIALQAQVAERDLTIAELKAKLEPPAPPAPKTVLDYGAKADGLAVCNAAFQAAADTGSLLVPAGRYLIDPTKPVLVRSGVVQMDKDAVLVLKPNAAERYYGLRVTGDDVVVSGGQILGERALHTYTAGSTHEWGCGLSITGNRVKVSNLRVEGCTGDGIGLSGNDCEIGPGVVSVNNRRNNLSVYDVVNPHIHDSEFSGAGNGGKPDPAGLIGPFAGIDVEPDRGSVSGLRIENNICAGNQRAGIVLWVRDEVTGTLSGVLSGNTVTGSPNAIWGCDEAVRAPTIAASILRNRLQYTVGAGVRADRGTRFIVGDADPANANTIDSASGSRTSAITYGIQEKNGGVAQKGQNTYV